MENIPVFTILLAADAAHLAELRMSVETWKKHKPWMFDAGVAAMMAFDTLSVEPQEASDFLASHWKLWAHVPADQKIENQRERMLSSFVLRLPEIVLTPWYMKIDSDCVASGPGEPDAAWFEGDPAFIASPWGYTKPAAYMDELDLWAQSVPELANHNPPPRTVTGFVARHRRMISHVMFGRTDYTRQIAGMCRESFCGPRMPVASQDTLISYVAARRGDFYRTSRMSRYGFAHVHPSRLKRVCDEIIQAS